MRRRKALGLLLAVGVGVVLALGVGVVLTAPDTALPWSVLGGAGGSSSSSTSFELGSTAGQSAIGLSESANFRLGAGYWYGAADSDGDGARNLSDPCPLNPDCDGDSFGAIGSQANGSCRFTNQPVFNDCVEAYVGTNPNLACGSNAWPADINSDTFSDISDIDPVNGSFDQAVPPAPRRHDLTTDGFVDISDIDVLNGFFDKSCL